MSLSVLKKAHIHNLSKTALTPFVLVVILPRGAHRRGFLSTRVPAEFQRDLPIKCHSEIVFSPIS